MLATPSNMLSIRMMFFSVDAMMGDYYVFKDILAAIGVEELPYKREDSNKVDPFAVPVLKN